MDFLSDLLNEKETATGKNREKIDALLHSGIDNNQMIVFEADIISDACEGSLENSLKVADALEKIRFYAEENSRKVRQARSLNLEIA